MDEFALIHRYFREATESGDDVRLGIGDDAAVVAVPRGWELAVCTDTLVVEHHFTHATPAADVGWKSLAVNLSDLAAMGAVPRWFTLSLTLPDLDQSWLRGFVSGMAELARPARAALIGGDMTRGPLAVSITAGGWVEPGGALRREGARAGDAVVVTGTLGDAALAFLCERGELRPRPGPGMEALLARLRRPTPRVAAGRVLRSVAHAGIDVSDGLSADLAHILSGGEQVTDLRLGAVLDPKRLPQSPAFAALVPDAQRAAALQLGGGDDYELCVCLAPENVEPARARLAAVGVAFTVVGTIVAEPGMWLESAEGRVPYAPRGFDHFPEPAR
ncbi:MAG TPA: thiamine-phosphate kinase [Nevskiaceae bacterium]